MTGKTDPAIVSQTNFFRRTQKAYIPLFIVFVIMTGIAAYVFLTLSRLPAETEEFVPQFSYEYEAKLDYTVPLKRNSLYSEPFLGPGRSYFAKIMDRIDIVFIYSYSCEPGAPVTGAYGVTATIASGEEKAAGASGGETRPVWQKAYEIVPPTPLPESAGTFSFQEEFSIRPETYAALADEMHKELGVVTRPNNLIIEGWVETEAQPGSGSIKRTAKANLLIPLGQSYFTLAGTPVAKDQNTLGETVKTALPEVIRKQTNARNALLVLGAITLILAVLAGIQIKQMRADWIARKRRDTSPIPRRYRDRIVNADPAGEIPAGKPVALDSLEGLVKIADDLLKPIIQYTHGSGRTVLYVLDGELRYEYSVL